MATVEIDETELRRYHQLGAVVNTILKHPKAKRLVQQAHKLVDPNAVTPELDQEAVLAAPLSAVEQKLDTFIEAQTKRDDEREKNERINGLKLQHTTGIAALRRDHRYTDEGIAAVEKLMEEKGLLDPLDAAAIFEKAHPPQAPATPSGNGAWNFAEGVTDDQSDIKKLLDSKGGNDLVVENMAKNILNEVRQASRR